KLGDQLIVGVSSDEFNALKGKTSVMTFEERKEFLDNIKYVDKVIKEENWEQKVNDILKYRIDVLVMGDDWKGQFDHLKEYCDVVYLPRTECISTTEIKKLLANNNN
ncbi:hypothetical protein, partial [Brachyspira pilosicoli]